MSLLALLLLAAPALTADFDRDGTLETVELIQTDTGGGAIVRQDGHLLSSFLRERYKPFAVRAGDIDHDGRAEILIGLHDRARRGSHDAMKLHIFSYRAGHLTPLWFTDRDYGWFDVIPVNGRSLLATIERRPGGNGLCLWEWTEFGFWLNETLFVSDVPFTAEVDGTELRVTNPTGRAITFYRAAEEWRTR